MLYKPYDDANDDATPYTVGVNAHKATANYLNCFGKVLLLDGRGSALNLALVFHDNCFFSVVYYNLVFIFHDNRRPAAMMGSAYLVACHYA